MLNRRLNKNQTTFLCFELILFLWIRNDWLSLWRRYRDEYCYMCIYLFSKYLANTEVVMSWCILCNFMWFRVNDLQEVGMYFQYHLVSSTNKTVTVERVFKQYFLNFFLPIIYIYMHRTFLRTFFAIHQLGSWQTHTDRHAVVLVIMSYVMYLGKECMYLMEIALLSVL